jgi:large subunit ribosomal protein L7/L12
MAMPAKKDDEKKKAEAVEKKAEEKKAEAAEEKADKPKAAKKKTEKKAEEKPAEEAPAKEKAEEPKAEEKKVEASSKSVEKIVEAVEKMTVLELSELVKVLEDRFGVTAAAPMAMMPGMMAGAGAAEEAEEKTEFDVVLTDFGSQKIQVIKVVRAITGLGLIEAKKMVEELPSNVKDGANKDEAEELKKQLEEVGATVEIK